MSTVTVDGRDSQIARHGIAADEWCARLDVAPQAGLDTPEVERRRAEHGPNPAPPTAPEGMVLG